MAKFIPKNYPNAARVKSYPRKSKPSVDQKKRAEGAASKRNGEYFEKMIEVACRYYRQSGIADIQKTPEPMRVIGVLDKSKGHFKAAFEKQAQPDFKGVLNGGQAIIFEAKHTNGKLIEQKRLSDEQVENFGTHYKFGAKCFVLVSFEMKRFYRIPWETWRDMQFIFKKKSVNESDIKGYEVTYANGIIDFLS